jgi:hypothetical protein
VDAPVEIRNTSPIPIKLEENFANRNIKKLDRIAELSIITITGFSFVYSKLPSIFLIGSFVLLAFVTIFSVFGIYLFEGTIFSLGGSAITDKKILFYRPKAEHFFKWIPCAYAMYVLAVFLFILAILLS